MEKGPQNKEDLTMYSVRNLDASKLLINLIGGGRNGGGGKGAGGDLERAAS